jgi:transforming growth factor-beta-induced protein
MLRFALVGILGVTAMVLAQSPAQAQRAADKDIVQTAIAAGSFTTLVRALEAADLVGTLEGKGPFTVFAPTDAAFAKLPAGTLENLLEPENKKELQRILTYHVVAGEVPSSEVVTLSRAKAVSGDTIAITVADGTVMVDNARVVTADVAASNGMIHVIDTVILPR